MDLIYEEWRHVAKYCEEEYGIQYDREEDFFTCAECGEPIYFSDFNFSDFSGEIDLWDAWTCPVCGFDFRTGEMPDEDQYGELFISSSRSINTIRGQLYW